jgi:hypothetical protein
VVGGGELGEEQAEEPFGGELLQAGGAVRARRGGVLRVRAAQCAGLPGLGRFWVRAAMNEMVPGSSGPSALPSACTVSRARAYPYSQPDRVVRIFPPGRVCASHGSGTARTEQAATTRSNGAEGQYPYSPSATARRLLSIICLALRARRKHCACSPWLCQPTLPAVTHRVVRSGTS